MKLAKLYAESVEPNLVDGDALFFGHGFNIRFGYIKPPAGVDVAMVAPKGPGHLVRREYTSGRGVPVLVAVENDATGKAWELALAYAIHKSFIFVRVPLTAAVTPKVVKTLRGWGWNIGRKGAVRSSLEKAGRKLD